MAGRLVRWSIMYRVQSTQEESRARHRATGAPYAHCPRIHSYKAHWSPTGYVAHTTTGPVPLAIKGIHSRSHTLSYSYTQTKKEITTHITERPFEPMSEVSHMHCIHGCRLQHTCTSFLTQYGIQIVVTVMIRICTHIHDPLQRTVPDSRCLTLSCARRADLSYCTRMQRCACAIRTQLGMQS